MVARLFFLSICLPFLLTSCQQSKKTVEFVDYVNPLMGTESTFAFSHGNTYPAVAVPWGMNFWSPQTGENGSGWMYTYADSLMRGFRQTHQPSPWMNDYGTFSIMPLAGELKMSHKERLVPFSHQQEKATPYNYSVTFDNGLQTSLSATSRGAVFEVSFPEKEDQYVVVDAYEGGTDEQFRTFYSCLYRTLLFPREFYKFDSQGNPVYYSPYDGNVHDGYMYTDNGFWDTFRAVHPLFTLLYPEVSERVTQSILNAYDESGFMPEWASPGHRGCMIGNNSVSLLVDAWMKGIQTVDAEKALEAMIHQTQARHAEIASVGRDGFEYYDKLGYVPYPEVPEATAKTLEYAYADWCIARFAESLGRQDIADQYYQKAQNYRNLYYPEHGFMWTKDAKGNWRDRFDATEWGGPFTEGSSWHWTWSVFHDPEGLSELMGGHEPMIARLDSMFVAPNTYNYGTYGFVIHEIAEMVALNMGQYAHGNQPVQHAIYLYDYIGQPWKTQYHLRNVMDKLYNSGSKGYCGDEDNGQTSAWYVFSAMGFYPVCPGMPEYAIGSPLFKKVTLHLPEGKNFVVSAADNAADRPYIRKALLNGQEFTRNYLTHDELKQGGELNLSMDSVPNQQRGTQPADFPYSYSK